MAPRLVAAACPQCGAGLSVGPGVDRVTCRHCQLTSFVHIPGRAEPPPPAAMPGVHYGHINLAVDPNAAGLAIGKAVLTSVILGIVGLVVVMGGVAAAIFANAPKIPSSTKITIGATNDGDGASETDETAAAAPKVPRVKAPDMKKVELSSLFTQAYELAKKENAQAQPTGFVVFKTEGGTVDLTSDAYASISFDYQYKDPKKRPGEDEVSGSISVVARDGELQVSHRTTGGNLHRVADAPTCKSTDMWAAVVASGVPANALATIHIYREGFKPQSPTVWSVRVDGHDEYRREVDVKTCKIRTDWSKR